MLLGRRLGMQSLISAGETALVQRPWVGPHLDQLAEMVTCSTITDARMLLHRPERSAVSELQVGAPCAEAQAIIVRAFHACMSGPGLLQQSCHS